MNDIEYDSILYKYFYVSDEEHLRLYSHIYSNFLFQI